MPVQGGLFDGGWEDGISELNVDLQGAVADSVLEAWRDNLDKNIRDNHGVYIGATRATRTDNATIVSDGGPDAGRTGLYGPWLEGQGSRNYPVTRFKGYNSARDAADTINAKVDAIGAPVVVKFVEAQNL